MREIIRMNQTNILELKNKMNERKMKQRPSIIIKRSRKRISKPEYISLDIIHSEEKINKKNKRVKKVCMNYGTLSTERKFTLWKYQKDNGEKRTESIFKEIMTESLQNMGKYGQLHTRSTEILRQIQLKKILNKIQYNKIQKPKTEF